MGSALQLQRTSMLTWLHDHLIAPDAGGVRVIGHSGVGKTHLLFDLYQQLRRQPGMMVGAHRFESEETPPLHPVLAAFGDAIGAHLERGNAGVDAWIGQLPPDMGAVARPMIRYALALGASADLGEPGSRWRLRDVRDAQQYIDRLYTMDRDAVEGALVRLMVTIVRHARLHQPGVRFVLVFDELENAGRLSRELLECILALPPTICTIVLGVNEGLISADLPLNEVVKARPSVELLPLNGAEGLKLYRRFGGENEEWDSEALAHVAAGNPMAIRFLVLSERFEQPFQRGRPLASGHLRPLLEALTQPAKEMLGMIAMLPTPMYLGRKDWAELLGLEPSSVEPMVKALIEQGLLGRFPHALVFAHRRHREIVQEELTTEERGALGVRLASFLERHYGRDFEQLCIQPTFSAFHRALRWAGEVADWMSSASDLLEGWYRMGEWRRARRYGHEMLERAERLTPAQMGRLLNILGMIAFHQARFEEAVDRFAEGEQALDEGTDGELIAILALNRIGAIGEVGRVQEARALLVPWLKKHLRISDDALLWQAWRQLAILEAGLGRVVAADDAYCRAINAASSAGLARMATELHHENAELLLVHGKLEEGMAHLNGAAEGCRELKMAREWARALTRMAVIQERRVLLVQAEGFWLNALGAVQEHGHFEPLWCTIACDYGGFLGRTGRGSEAVRILEQALERARFAGRTTQEARILNNLAILTEAVVGADVAVEHLRAAQRIKHRVGDRRGEAIGNSNLGALLFSLSKYDEASTALEHSLEFWSEVQDASGRAVTLNNLAMLSERLGDVDDALKNHRLSLEIKRHEGDYTAVRQTLINMVVLLDGADRLGAAQEYMRMIIDMDQEVRHPELCLEEAYLEELGQRRQVLAQQSPGSA